MEYYERAECVEVQSEPPFPRTSATVVMQVQDGSKMRNLLAYAFRVLNEGRPAPADNVAEPKTIKVERLVWAAHGTAIGKAISCAEVFKRKHGRMQQLTRLFYRRFEEIYRPRQPVAGSSSAPPPVEGALHPLRVSIEVPAIEILLAPAHTSPLTAAEIDASYQTSDALTSELAWFRPPALSPAEYASRAASAASATTASQSEPRAASTRGPVTGWKGNHQQELAPAPASYDAYDVYDAYDASSRTCPSGDARAAGRRARGAGGRDFHRRARGRFAPYAEPRAMRATAAGGGEESIPMAPGSDQMGDVTPSPFSCPPLSGGESLAANANALSSQSEPLPASAGASSQVSGEQQQQPQERTRGGRWRARGMGAPRAVGAEEAGGAMLVDPTPARGLPYRRGQRRGGGRSGFGWRGEQWRARGNGVAAVRGGAEAGFGSSSLTANSDRASQSLANVAVQQDLGKSEKHIANTIESKDSNPIDA